MLTPEILKLYGLKTAEPLEIHDSSHGEQDRRLVYVVESPEWGKLAIKVTRNSFTTPERVRGWAELIEHYNKLGIYCPRIVRSRNGDYSAMVGGYLVYAEEYMRYEPANSWGELAAGKLQYKPELYKSIGLVAANPAPLVPWHTAFCLYDKFDETDEYDENFECAVKIREIYVSHIHEHADRMNRLFEAYCRRREEFEPVYRSLPKAVFQGDLNSSNVLVTQTGHFAGLIDFNLSGTETILNYAFCESFCSLDGGEGGIALLMDTAALRKRDRRTAQSLAWIGEHYKFTETEREAFNEYYNIVAPFRWTYQGFFMGLLTNRDRYPHGRKYAGLILDWMEYQATRKDVVDLLP